MIKNIKKTLTILLCYIFVVMMLPTNVIAKAVQAASTNLSDYSSVFENGYAQPVLYKNKALISVGSFSGYKFYEDGEIIESSPEQIRMSISGGRNRFAEISLFDNDKEYIYDMKNNNLIDIDSKLPDMEKAISNKVGYQVNIYYASTISSDDETLWYRSGFTNNKNEWYDVILNEDFTKILILQDIPYEIIKVGDTFVTHDYSREEDEKGNFVIKNYITTISLDGKVVNVDTTVLDGKDIYIHNNDIYTNEDNTIKKYKISKEKVSLVSTISIKNIDIVEITTDSNGDLWFVGNENNNSYIYELENSNPIKRYKVNNDYSEEENLCTFSVYDNNNIVISSWDKYTIIQNKANKWISENGKWYYYNSKGQLATGWLQISGVWYYFDNSGIMQTGWQSIGGAWYYFNNSGAMATGWLNNGGTWYYFDNSGAMQTGWQSIGGTWYYFNNSGAMATGWLNNGGTWYYFNNSGAMQTGWQSIGGAWYYFNNSGAMATGWLNNGGTWYYFNNSGVMQTGWQSIGGTWYYFNNSGAMATGWLNNGGKWYYLNNSGEMQTGWQYIGGIWYYFYSGGNMAVSTVIDGWNINGSGVATQ